MSTTMDILTFLVIIIIATDVVIHVIEDQDCVADAAVFGVNNR